VKGLWGLLIVFAPDLVESYMIKQSKNIDHDDAETCRVRPSYLLCKTIS